MLQLKVNTFILFALFLFLDPSTLYAQKKTTKHLDKIIQSRKLRDRIKSDPHRPAYHFVSPEGIAWPFDPNGAIYWNGKYHVGFIYQSYRKGFLEHFWGHSVSSDLLHWTLYPDMLNVKDGDIEKGIFSGGAFLSREGIPHIMYHGQGSGTNLVAYSTDPDLRVWKKFEGNPVLKTPEEEDPDYDKYWAWDPEGWYDKETDYYYQITGGRQPTGPSAGYFRSKDMYEWEYLGNFIDQDTKVRYDWEDLSCPDFFPIGDKHMLLFISHNLGTQYYLGEYKKGKFTIEKHARMNWPGGTFFAPEQLVDDRGRNIIWGWVLQRTPPDHEDFGWDGIMSMPRVVSLSSEGEVEINPPEEFKNLRMSGVEEIDISLNGNEEKELALRGKTLEIQVEMKGGSTTAYGVKVFCSPNGNEETVIKYDPVAKELVVDFAKSAVSGKGMVKMRPNIVREPMLEGFLDDVSEQRAPFELKDGETLKLDIFIDRSIIEIFANGRQCVTQVVYPELEESNLVRIFSGDEKLDIVKAQVWQMARTNVY